MPNHNFEQVENLNTFFQPLSTFVFTWKVVESKQKFVWPHPLSKFQWGNAITTRPLSKQTAVEFQFCRAGNKTERKQFTVTITL